MIGLSSWADWDLILNFKAWSPKSMLFFITMCWSFHSSLNSSFHPRVSFLLCSTPFLIGKCKFSWKPLGGVMNPQILLSLIFSSWRTQLLRQWVSNLLLLEYVSENILRDSTLKQLIIYRNKNNIHETFVEQLPVETLLFMPL